MTVPGDRMPRRALVLGGGGSTGNAWLIGIVAGLTDAGLDVTAPEVTVGTSAGATAAAQLAGSTPGELIAAVLDAAPGPPPTRPGRAAGPVVDHLARTRAIIDASRGAADMRRRMGAAALARAEASDGTWQAQWRATVAARLPGAQWPQRTLLVTAVDAATGEPTVFDRSSGVELVDAVAASCASGLPYQVGDRRYIDGGYRRNENADLAADCDRVLVLSPLGGRTLHPLAWGLQLAAQVDELRAAGATVVTVVPHAEHLFGANAMDVSARPAAARVGQEQGRALADRIAELWT